MAGEKKTNMTNEQNVPVTPEDDFEIAPEEEPEVSAPAGDAAETAEAKAEEAAETAAEKAEEAVETAKEVAETAAEEAEDAVETAEETAETAVEDAEEAAEIAEEKAEEAVSKTAKAAKDSAEDFETVKAGAKSVSAAAAEKGPDLAMAAAAGITAQPVRQAAKKAAEQAAAAVQAEAEKPSDDKPKKKKKTGLYIAGGLLLAVIAGCGIWAWNFWKTNSAKTTFLDRTWLYGEDISGRTPEDIAAEILKKEDKIKITLTEEGKVSAEGSAKDFGLTLDKKALTDSIESAQKAQTSNVSTVFGSLYKDYPITTAEAWKLDESVLNEKIRTQNLKVKRAASFDAYLDFDEEKNCALIVPEIYGNRFDKKTFEAYMKDALLADFGNVVLSEDSKYTIEFPEELYVKPKVTKEDPELNRLCDSYNEFAGTDITYTFGEEEQKITFKEICDMCEVNGTKATLSEEAVAAYVSQLAEKYDTRGIARTYTSHDGYETEFAASQVEYGYTIDQEAETEQLYAEIMDHEKVSREPIYLEGNKWGNPYYYSRNGVDDLNGTFIEVSLADQHVWFYKEGRLIVDGDCVTGNLSRKMGTSRGMYPIAFKRSPAVLRGGTGKGAYATPVTYWMPFNGGQGLHDATWRGRFGGNIYKSSGSHGCVNLPKKVAKEIYENCTPGMCVIVY